MASAVETIDWTYHKKVYLSSHKCLDKINSSQKSMPTGDQQQLKSTPSRLNNQVSSISEVEESVSLSKNLRPVWNNVFHQRHEICIWCVNNLCHTLKSIANNRKNILTDSDYLVKEVYVRTQASKNVKTPVINIKNYSGIKSKERTYVLLSK